MTSHKPCDIYSVARQCGVILRNGIDHSPTSRKPRECYCKDTLRGIGREHGEAHLKLVLMLMTGTRSNSRELYSDMMKAVSALLAHDPNLLKSKTLLDDFNSLDLGGIRRRVKLAKLPVENWKALLVLISQKFLKPMQGDLLDHVEEAA